MCVFCFNFECTSTSCVLFVPWNVSSNRLQFIVRSISLPQSLYLYTISKLSFASVPRLAREQAHLFGYREPAERGKASLRDRAKLFI